MHNTLCRWTVDDASIFSVDDGKRLAQTPHKPLTFYERIRLEKQQKAALETPLVKGIRLLPEFTPGRAMLWGSILAVWGTAALVVSTAKSLDIKTVILLILSGFVAIRACLHSSLQIGVFSGVSFVVHPWNLCWDTWLSRGRLTSRHVLFAYVPLCG